MSDTPDTEAIAEGGGENFQTLRKLRGILSKPPADWTGGESDWLADLAKQTTTMLADPLLVRICGNIHPTEVEWHCQCRKDPGHKHDHRCYGCGFEWKQGDPHSKAAQEDATTAADIATAESMYRPNGQWRHDV